MKKTSREWGAIGGNLTKKKYGVKHYKEVGLKGALKRWGERQKSKKLV